MTNRSNEAPAARAEAPPASGSACRATSRRTAASWFAIFFENRFVNSRKLTAHSRPAMEAGISSHVWSIVEIVGRLDAADKQAA